MLIAIKPEEVVLAKQITTEFDKQKTYDKFQCNTNYVGVLGEIVFDRFLNEQEIYHTWVKFIKKDPNKPDFIINNVSIDLKTTYSDSMWFQNPIFDVYIYAQISTDNKYLVINNFICKEGLIAYMNSTSVITVKRGDRIDYVIKPNNMFDISLFGCLLKI